MRRLRSRILLLAALALAFGPRAAVSAGWSCPDGTLCVSEDGREYRCAAPGCSAGSCCERSVARACRHSRLPAPASGSAALGAGDHCRFHASVSALPHAAAVSSRGAPGPSGDALPGAGPVWAPPLSLSPAAPGRAERHPPPPLLPAPPARAPPGQQSAA